MQTSIKLDKHKPNILKNAIILHIASPAFQLTVMDQPISKGIMMKVTWNDPPSTIVIAFNVDRCLNTLLDILQNKISTNNNGDYAQCVEEKQICTVDILNNSNSRDWIFPDI